MDCIFCKIVKGEIPSSKLYEDKNSYAFLDIMPIRPGHALVIPKKHYETMLDIPDDCLKDMAIATKKVSKAVKEGLEAEGFNVQMNNYEASGQLVPHAHFHIVPRVEGDGLKLWPGGSYEKGEKEKIAKQISHFL